MVQQHQRHAGLAPANNVYGAVGIPRLQHNLPAVQAFRTSAADAVTQALHDLGQKYNYSIPLENPLVFKNTGSVPDKPGIQIGARVPAGRPGAVHARAGRPHRPHRPGVVRRPRDPVTRRHRPVRLEHRPARGRRRQPVPVRLPEQADAVRGVRAGLEQRLLLEPQLLGLRNRARAGRVRPAVGRTAARCRVRRDVVLLRARVPAGGRRGAEARPPDRLLRDDAQEADGADDRELRRGLQPGEERQDEEPHVLLGLRRRQPGGVDEELDDPAHVPDAGRVA